MKKKTLAENKLLFTAVSSVAKFVENQSAMIRLPTPENNFPPSIQSVNPLYGTFTTVKAPVVIF